MEGFVVTPTTVPSSIWAARLPLTRRSRDRSSSQTETPSRARSCSGLVIEILLRVAGGGLRGTWGLSPGPVSRAVPGDLRPGLLNDRLGGEAELGEQLLQRRGGAEGRHADDGTLGTGVALPAQGRGLLDGHPGLDGG